MKLFSELVEKEAIKFGMDPVKTSKTLSKFIEDRTAFVLRNLDTVLLVKTIDKNNAELHLFSEDSPIIVAKSIKKFWKELALANIKTVYGLADNDQIVKLMKAVHLPIEDSDRPQYNWKLNIL